MAQQTETLRFHTPSVFAGKTGTIDHQNCIIFGVALITGDLIAEGHDLKVDSETVTQLHELAKAKGKVPVNLDHGSGIMATCGYIDEFRLDGNKLRGNWHLLKSHDETPKMMERADTMPDCFGLSVAFKGSGVAVKGGGKAARAEKLLSVDCVTRPAANEGLFSAKDGSSVDTHKKGMADQLNQTQEPSLNDMMALLQNISARQDAFEQAQGEIINHINSQAESQQPENENISREQLEQLYYANDDDLASIGLTRDEVNAAVSEYNSSVTGESQEQNGYEGNQYGGQGNGEQGAEGSMAGAGAETTAAFRALHKDVIALKAKIKATELSAQVEGEEMQFEAITSNLEVLAAQRDKAIELAEQLVSENEALHLAVRTGTRPVTAGVDTGVRLFSANHNGQLHPFQARVKELQFERKLTEGQAIQFATKENPAIHQDWLQSQSIRG